MLANLKNVVKHSFIYSIGNISTKLSGVILLPLYTEYLAISDYGLYGLIETTTLILISLFQLGLPTAFQRWYFDKKYIAKRKELFATVFFSLFILNICLFTPFFFLSKNISVLLFKIPDYFYTINVALVVSILQIITNTPSLLMKIQEKSIFFVTTNFIKLIITLGATMLLIAKFNRGINGIFEGQLIGLALYLLIISKYTINNICLKINFNLLKEMVKFSIPILFTILSNIIMITTDKFMLNYLIKEESLKIIGIYTLGVRIANLIKLTIVQSLGSALPAIILTKMDDENNKRFYSKMLTYSILIINFSILGLSLFSEELLKLLAHNNADYWDAEKIIPVISLSFIFTMTIYFLNYNILIIKKTKIIAQVIFISAMANIILNSILIPVMDIYGAAIASLISLGLQCTLLYRRSQKQYFVPYELKKILLMTLLCIGILVLRSTIKDIDLFWRITMKLILLCSFPVILYFFNFYESIELKRLKGVWNKWIGNKFTRGQLHN